MRGAAARGAPAGAEGRFFKEKAPQKPFWEKVFWGWWEWVRTWRLLGLGAVRPVFAEGKDRLAVGVSFGGAIFLLGEIGCGSQVVICREDIILTRPQGLPVFANL